MMSYPTIGEIVLFAGNFAPQGWARCDGQTLTVRGNEALFSILGAQYGGDGIDTFQLPKLASIKEADGGSTPIYYYISLEGYYPCRAD